MKAFRAHSDTRIAPFGDDVSETMVDGRTLAEVQASVLAAAGCTPVDHPPADEPYLLYSDRTWFTAEAVRRLVRLGEGRFRAKDDAWFAWTGAQQSTPAPGVYELAVVRGAPSFENAEPVDVEMGLRDLDLNVRQKAFAKANERTVRVGPAMVHQVHHWTHIIRINQLALLARAEEARFEWESAGWLKRAAMALRLLWKLRTLNPGRIPGRLSEVGENASVHPTAVVEFSIIGEGCEIGPHAVVRGSVLAAGAKVDSHGTVNASVLGVGAHVGRYGHVNLCSLYPGAMVSSGSGFQSSVFGRDSFMAWGSTVLDLSFGASIKVEVDGPGSERVDTQEHFMGAAIGHDAKIGNGVKIGFGVAVPNNALVVDGGEMLREWGSAPVGEAVVIRSGKPEPIR
ncbi:MAG: hypothetical protein VX127_18370 [Myxococcota bacterium]|nr:hypothetical protein [Myxococcota bacterium]